MAEGWPSSEAENLARLKDAGVPLERGVPKCLRCKGESTSYFSQNHRDPLSNLP